MTHCAHCGVKWVQSRGLCQACDREVGADVRTTFERDRDRLAKSQPRCRVPDLEAAPLRTVTVDGREFEVTWPREWVRR